MRAAVLVLAMMLAGGGLAFAGAAAMPAMTADRQDRGALDAAMRLARSQQRAAEARAIALERAAQGSGRAADRAMSEAAALAARVQQAEAGMAAAQAELALVVQQGATLERQLEARQAPLLRLTGALQTMASRPVTLSLFQPGSLRDLVHTRAVLASAAPEIRTRTASLRAEMGRMAQLRAQRARIVADLRRSQDELSSRRTTLVALAEGRRIAASRTSGTAARERSRALALAEEAHTLDELVGGFDANAALRQRLAALPGPLPRPADPSRQPAAAVPAPAPARQKPAEIALQLPVTGRIVTGFNAPTRGDARSAGLAIAPPGDALVVAPAAGKVAFAGPYEGYGRIVILEHSGGYSSLVTGLGAVSVGIGQRVGAGYPLGRAESGRGGAVGFEFRRGGTPVNPLDYLRAAP